MINIDGRWVADGGFSSCVEIPRSMFTHFKIESFLILACENEELGREEVAEELFAMALRCEIASHQIAMA